MPDDMYLRQFTWVIHAVREKEKQGSSLQEELSKVTSMNSCEGTEEVTDIRIEYSSRA